MFLFLVVFFGIILSSCSNQSDLTKAETISKSDLTSICGNNIVESGETSKNCCLDVSCSEFSVCKELKSGEKLINTCVKEKLEDTKEYKKIKQLLNEENFEYSKKFGNIDFKNIAYLISEMNSSETKLAKGYNTSLLNVYISFRKGRLDYNLLLRDYEKLLKNAESDPENLSITYKELIQINKNELQRLESINKSFRELINENFDYNINNKISYLKDLIKTRELELIDFNLKPQVQLKIIDYKSSCNGIYGCYLDFVKLRIKNIGKKEINDVKFDFYILKGDKVVSREVDVYGYDVSNLGLNFEGFFKETYIGSDDNLTPDEYLLKVDIKEGIGIKVLNSTEMKVTLK